MNLEEFELIGEKEPAVVTVSVDEVPGPDRTLLYGYDVGKNTWHFYKSDGFLHLYIYTITSEVLQYKTGFLFAASDIVPNKRIYPAASDVKFSRLLLAKGVYIPWTNWNRDQYSRSKERKFYGLTKR